MPPKPNKSETLEKSQENKENKKDKVESKIEQLSKEDQESLAEFRSARSIAKKSMKDSVERSNTLLGGLVGLDVLTEVAEGSVVGEVAGQAVNLAELGYSAVRVTQFEFERAQVSKDILSGYQEAHKQGLISETELKRAEEQLKPGTLKAIGKATGRITKELALGVSGYLVDILPFDVGISAATTTEAGIRTEVQFLKGHEDRLDKLTSKNLEAKTKAS